MARTVVPKLCVAVGAFATWIAASATVPALAGAQPASDSLSCGQTIVHSTVLAGDVGPCTGNGIVVGADHVTLDLNGHHVFATPTTGKGAGIYLLNRSGVTVTHGSVSNFNGGVVIEGGSSNAVVRIEASDNLGGKGSDYGDGILMESSSNNKIIGNRVVHNGPYSGIGIVSLVDSDHPRATTGTSTKNLIIANAVADNNVGRSATLDDNDGIRVEPSSPGNWIIGNQVSGSGLDGISLFRASGDSKILANKVSGNGFQNQVGRHGDGIILFNLASHNLVAGNVVTGNAANGIQVRGPVGTTAGSTENRIVGNSALGNSQLPFIPSKVFGPTFDLKDANPSCDADIWRGNRYGTAFPACTTTGGRQVP